jgi:hypothetical protein
METCLKRNYKFPETYFYMSEFNDIETVRKFDVRSQTFSWNL